MAEENDSLSRLRKSTWCNPLHLNYFEVVSLIKELFIFMPVFKHPSFPVSSRSDLLMFTCMCTTHDNPN